MSCGITFGVIFQLDFSIRRHNIFIETNQVLVLYTAVRIMAGETRGPTLPANFTLDMFGMVRETLIVQNAITIMALIAKSISGGRFHGVVSHNVVTGQEGGDGRYAVDLHLWLRHVNAKGGGGRHGR